MLTTPPKHIIDAACDTGAKSPCAKSKRGVAIWAGNGKRGALAVGFNAQPRGFKCNGSRDCAATCGRLCEHAEAAALRQFRWTGRGFDMLHVKVVEIRPGAWDIVASGPPSCVQCSIAILSDERISGMWLLHDDGWRRYTTTEFHRHSLAHHHLPILESP